MSQNLQKFAKFPEFQLDNLVAFEKCCKTHIFLQKLVPIQPRTSNILPKNCQLLQLRRASAPGADASRAPRTPNCRARDIRGHVDTGPSTNFVECFAKLVDGPVMTTYMICLCMSLKKQLYLRVMCTFKFRFASSNIFQRQLHVQYP